MYYIKKFIKYPTESARKGKIYHTYPEAAIWPTETDYFSFSQEQVDQDRFQLADNAAGR